MNRPTENASSTSPSAVVVSLSVLPAKLLATVCAVPPSFDRRVTRSRRSMLASKLLFTQSWIWVM